MCCLQNFYFEESLPLFFSGSTPPRKYVLAATYYGFMIEAASLQCKQDRSFRIPALLMQDKRLSNLHP